MTDNVIYARVGLEIWMVNGCLLLPSEEYGDCWEHC